MIVLRNQKDLVDYFAKCVENHAAAALFITIPGCEKAELIINQRENFEYKLDYYSRTYNDNLEHKFAPGIKIVGATVLDERW